MAAKPPAPGSISGDKLCALTGLTDRRHRQLAKDGFFPAPNLGEYQLTPTIQGLFRYYREQRERSKGKLGEEILARTVADRELAEIEVAKAKGLTLDARQVETVWTELLMAARRKWLQLPPKAGIRFLIFASAKDCEAWIEDEVRDILSELAAAPEYGKAKKEESE